MFAYAVVAYLDKATEDTFRELWLELSEKNITQYGVEVKSKRPHITIADYDNLDKSEFQSKLKNFCENQEKVDLDLKVLGTFMNTGTLFIAPPLSKDLSDFHNNYHKALGVFNDNENSFYLPGRWFPHLTVASRLSEENMLSAFVMCRENINKLKGNINEIALLEIEINSNGIAIDSKDIFVSELK